MRKLLAAAFAVLFAAGVASTADACPYKGKDHEDATSTTS